MKLSVIIPTLNEEKNIGECIESIGSLADEVIVVDMGSSDKTCKIVKKLGACLPAGRLGVFEKKAKEDQIQAIQSNVNFGIKRATGSWIMRLDADERLTDEFKKELVRKINEDKWDAFLIWRRQWFVDGFLTGGDWAKSKIVRVFKKGCAYYDLSLRVHEKFVVKGKVGEIKAPFDHYSHMDLATVIARFNKYTDAEGKDKAGRRFLFLDMLVRPVYVFIRTMTIKGEWRDGTRGVVAGLLWAFYQFLAYAKAWEIKTENKSKREKKNN